MGQGIDPLPGAFYSQPSVVAKVPPSLGLFQDDAQRSLGNSSSNIDLISIFKFQALAGFNRFGPFKAHARVDAAKTSSGLDDLRFTIAGYIISCNCLGDFELDFLGLPIGDFQRSL